MNKWSEILFGLILIVAAVLVWGYSLSWGGFWDFGNASWEFFKGGLIWMMIMVGLLFLLLGISDLRG